MSMQTRLATGTALALALAVGAAPAAADQIRVGYSPPTYDISDFMGQFEIGLKEALEAYGYDLEMLTRSPADHTAHLAQLNIVEDLITAGVDYMIIIPTGFETQIPAYRAVNEAGIPLIIGNYLDPLPEETGVDVVRYAGYSHAEGGRLAGEWIAERYGEGARVAIIYGEAGTVSNERGGLAKEIVEAAGLEVVAEEYADWDRMVAFQAVQDILTREQELDVIYAASSAMAIGAVAAAKSMDYVPNVDVDIIGFGGTIEELDAILGGDMRAVVFRDPIATGGGAAEAIHLLHTGRADEITQSWGVPLLMVDSCESVVEAVHPVTFTSEGREPPTLEQCK
jgi:ribose transport system substrate-binding protein